MSRSHVRAMAVVGALLVLPACSPAGSTDGTGDTAAPAGAITVLAASSLTGAFTTLGRDFEAAHPGTSVTFSFASSSTLATQVVQGAPADVFAAADVDTMATVTAAGAGEQPTVFATNTLEIAVPPGNPGQVTGLADFAEPGLRIALCAEQVPCGAAAVRAFAAAGVQPRPDTLESDVKSTLQKVVSDEVDAALVYRTDVAAAGPKVEGLPFPEASAAVNAYPIAVLPSGRNPVAARAFVDHVLSADGRRVLAGAGFGRP